MVYLSAFLTLQAPLSISCLEERREKGGKGEESIEDRIEDRIEGGKRGMLFKYECLEVFVYVLQSIRSW